MDQGSCSTGGPVNEAVGASMNDNHDAKSSRKRTKTGCLTCRQRRIKCGEERPTCQNCSKSKRECQGYNQRVIFKEPLNAMRPPTSVSRPAAAGFQQQPNAPFQQYEHPSQRAPLQKYEEVRTKAPSFNNFHIPTDSVINSGPLSNPSHQQRFHSYHQGSGSSTSESSPEATAPLTPSFQSPEDLVYYADQPPPPHVSQEVELQYEFDALAQHQMKEQQRPHPDETAGSFGWNVDRNSLDAFHESYRNNPNCAFRPLGESLRLGGDQYYAPYQPEHIAPRDDQRSLSPGENQQSPYSLSPQHHSENFPLPQFNSWQETVVMSRANGDFDQEAEVDIQDQHLRQTDIGNIMALKAVQDNQNLSLRSFSSFLDEPDAITTYQPSSSPTPLEDPMTAKIFLHFINVTGQNISLYERHPADPGLMFSGRPVPHDNQHLWSYTMPTLALTNPGLLHAMLAISSLHMAKLQETSTIPSLRHYHIALRRVAKTLNSPRRGHSATLAATLLLGFYEVLSTDHQKWTSHLLGAKQLMKEINFAEKSKEVKAIKKQRRERHAHSYVGELQWPQRPFAEYDEEVDEDFVSVITGQKLDDDRRGTIVDEEKTSTHIHTDRDVEIYETQRDLFWWYCKQDVYQSILSGNKLFIDYENWSDCPPRAPMGRWEASYGTFDHVILLLGRIASFASKDLCRKKKVMKLNGGVWRPPPGMTMPGPPPGGPPQEQTGPPRTPQMPPFAGMMPVGGPATLPMGFVATHNSPKQYEDDESLDVQTAKAIKEWEEIQNAFRILTTRMGQDFRPVRSVLANPIETPFGQAYQFKSYAMAGIWMNYYMGLIVHARSHPSMPPAAQMAAGIAAGQTRAWSRELGRVCGGLVTPESEGELTTLHGSAMIECSVPMFTAAVQYQGPDERQWAVRKLRDIARLTGWRTAAIIASGCEGAWIKAAENGKGPPYTRPDGELGFGHARPHYQSDDKGGVYWGFDGNRIGVPRAMEEENSDESSNTMRRDRRAILYNTRDKEFATGADMRGLNLET